MNLFRLLGITIGLSATLALIQGCSFLSDNNELAIAEGPVVYVNNTLEVNDAMPLRVVWGAAKTSLQELQIPISLDKKDRKSARLDGRDAKNRDVTVQLIRSSHYMTAIQITVGKIDCTENRSEAAQIHQRMTEHYGQ